MLSVHQISLHQPFEERPLTFTEDFAPRGDVGRGEAEAALVAMLARQREAVRRMREDRGAELL